MTMRNLKKTAVSWAMAILLGVAAPAGLEAATVSAATIKETVKACIEKNMPWPAGNVRILFPVKIQDVRLPGSRVICEAMAKRNESYVGDSVYTVRFYDGDTLLREERVRVRQEVLLDVAVSVRALEKDSEIRKGDIRFEGRWFAEMPANAVTDLREVEGKRLVHGVRPNCEITKSILKNGTLVRRGKMVRIILESGPMTVLTSGLSEEDGGRNDVVRVRNTSSSRIVYARVVDENTVRVDF